MEYKLYLCHASLILFISQLTNLHSFFHFISTTKVYNQSSKSKINILANSAASMAARYSLCRFPAEILDLISSYMHPEDIKAFRATSGQIHASASPHLFRRVLIALRPRTWEVFEYIMNDPLFCKNVTEIVYDGSQFVLDHQDTYETYMNDQCLHGNYEICSLQYDQLYQTQEQLICNHQFRHVLSVASSKFPRLELFTYSNWRNICNESPWYFHKGPLSWDVGIKTVCFPVMPDEIGRDPEEDRATILTGLHPIAR